MYGKGSSHIMCSTAIAIRGKDGVVLGVEKLVTSKLHEPTANKRIFTIDKHIGVVSDDACSCTLPCITIMIHVLYMGGVSSHCRLWLD